MRLTGLAILCSVLLALSACGSSRDSAADATAAPSPGTTAAPEVTPPDEAASAPQAPSATEPPAAAVPSPEQATTPPPSGAQLDSSGLRIAVAIGRDDAALAVYNESGENTLTVPFERSFSLREAYYESLVTVQLLPADPIETSAAEEFTVDMVTGETMLLSERSVVSVRPRGDHPWLVLNESIEGSVTPRLVNLETGVSPEASIEFGSPPRGPTDSSAYALASRDQVIVYPGPNEPGVVLDVGPNQVFSPDGKRVVWADESTDPPTWSVTALDGATVQLGPDGDLSLTHWLDNSRVVSWEPTNGRVRILDASSGEVLVSHDVELPREAWLPWHSRWTQISQAGERPVRLLDIETGEVSSHDVEPSSGGPSTVASNGYKWATHFESVDEMWVADATDGRVVSIEVSEIDRESGNFVDAYFDRGRTVGVMVPFGSSRAYFVDARSGDQQMFDLGSQIRHVSVCDDGSFVVLTARPGAGDQTDIGLVVAGEYRLVAAEVGPARQIVCVGAPS